MSKSAILKSSLAKKYWMAATGLFLCLFLMGHLAGNLQLFLPGEQGQLQFNAYANFMTSYPLVMLLSYITYFSILFHAVDGALITRNNMRARKHGYAHNKPSENSHWTSRNMGILGTVILVFIILHMSNFWYTMHFGEIPRDSVGNKDLHTVVMVAFSNPGFGLIYTIGYVLAMAAVGFHLVHGVQSAFQSIGLRIRTTTKAIKIAAYIFAIVVPVLFASIPVYIYLTHS